MPDEIMSINYRIVFDEQRTEGFEVQLNQKTLSLVTTPRQDVPMWTQLDYCQCANCPWKAGDRKFCPVAVNLVDIIDFFKDFVSHQEVNVEVETPSRTYKKKTTLQDAVSSLIGIFMVTSGCPILSKLKPMVGTHLPFATLEETTYRAITMYLLAQFFLARRGKAPDWDLTGLAEIYDEVHTVNRGFFERVKEAQVEDAGLNALVHLDCFAEFANLALLDSDLKEWEQHFDAYLEAQAS